jgi:hypothetical protein
METPYNHFIVGVAGATLEGVAPAAKHNMYWSREEHNEEEITFLFKTLPVALESRGRARWKALTE